MANKTLVPEGKFKILTVGPTRNWTFKADNGDIEMTTYSVQLEGQESLWVDLNQKADSDAPKPGQEIEGKIEQDEAGKYAPRFKKASQGRGGYGGGGGGAASPGAIWSATFATAAQIVSGFLENAPAEKKKKASASVEQYLTLVEVVAIKLRALVDKHAGETTTTATAAPAKSESESGESASAPAATPKTEQSEGKVEIQDLDDSDLGDW